MKTILVGISAAVNNSKIIPSALICYEVNHASLVMIRVTLNAGGTHHNAKNDTVEIMFGKNAVWCIHHSNKILDPCESEESGGGEYTDKTSLYN